MKNYALLALAVTAGLSTAALAQDDNINVNADNGATRTATVNIADLDLHQPAGRLAVHSRVKQAINAVCGEETTTRSLDSACAATAQRDASRQIYAVFADKSGRLAQNSVVISGAR